MRTTLMTKALQQAPLNADPAVNPATLTRPGHVEMDQGRPWAGDLYDYGAVSDPGEAFASFGDGDVEAWLDKGDDGVLIGWVREGEAIYRYSDPEMWSIDVDGAGIQRTDGGSASMEGEPIPDGAGDELAAGGEEMLGDEASTADASVGDLDPVAFDEEPDDAMLTGDPTDVLEDPTDPLVAEVTGDGGPDAQGAFADMLTDDTLPDPNAPADQADPDAAAEGDDEPLEYEEEDPAADVAPVAPDEVSPADPPTDEPVVPDVEGAELPEKDDEEEEDEDEVLTIAPGDLPTTDDEDDEDDEDEEDEGKKNRPFERKHLPGQHNQETHGNRVSIGARAPRSRSASTGPSSGDSTSAAPAGGKRATISKPSIAAMSDKDLNAIMHDGTFYDDATMMAAADELDQRDPLDDRFRNALADTVPGSLEEHRLLRDVIPSEWITWAATSRKPQRSAMAQREDEWLSFMQSQYLAALNDPGVNGQFFAARYRAKPPFGEMAFFDGTAGIQQARKYMSPELKEWWDNHWVTKAEFMAEFSDAAKKRQDNTKRDDLHA